VTNHFQLRRTAQPIRRTQYRHMSCQIGKNPPQAIEVEGHSFAARYRNRRRSTDSCEHVALLCVLLDHIPLREAHPRKQSFHLRSLKSPEIDLAVAIPNALQIRAHADLRPHHAQRVFMLSVLRPAYLRSALSRHH